MKSIMQSFTDEEFKGIYEAKIQSRMTWRDFLMTLAKKSHTNERIEQIAPQIVKDASELQSIDEKFERREDAKDIKAEDAATRQGED